MEPSALFTRLLDLHARYPGRVPEEDFFTELVAYLFETQPAILIAWLKGLGWQEPLDDVSVRVDTQAEYGPLPEHHSGSCPDIRIQLLARETCHVIFIESKLGAEEGDRQLQRYAEILNNDRHAGQKWLVYITRRKETKDPGGILLNLPASAIKFIQLRWRSFYRFLIEQPQDFLITEVTCFMEENGMGKPIQFSAGDLPALGNLQHPFQLILGVLDQELRRNFQAVVGRRSALTPLEYLAQDWARFSLEGEILEKGLFCMLGFDNLAVGGEPKIMLMLHAQPEKEYGDNRALRVKLIGMFKDIQAKRSGWGDWDLDDPRKYSGIIKYRHLRELLPSDDIEDDCKAVLQSILDELVEIKRSYPDIPWN